MELLNLTQEGDTFIVPRERICDVASANSIAQTILEADRPASYDRAKCRALLDGFPPYSQEELIALGQGARTNNNFLECQSEFESALAPYHELINGVDRFINCYPSHGVDRDRVRWGNIIAEEFTRTLKDWRQFNYQNDKLFREFVGFGVGLAYWKDDIDWRYETGGWDDFAVPRGTKANEEEVDVIVMERPMLPHQLYAKISDREEAEKLGWNIRAVESSIAKATSVDNRMYDDFEQIEKEIKNNDFYYSYGAAKSRKIWCRHMLTREFDGSYSHYIFDRDTPSAYLYKKRFRYKCAQDAFIFFTAGTGNGDIHSIRGMLYKGYPQWMMSNRLQCQVIDSAMISSTMLVQPESEKDVENLGVSYFGPFAVLSSGMRVVQNNVQFQGGVAAEVMNLLSRQRQNNLGSYQSRAVTPEGGERTATEVEAQLAMTATLSTAAVNTFYYSWQPLMEATFRRLNRPDWVETEPGGREALDFRKRCLVRGVPAKALDSHCRIEAVRSIGYGSPAKRLMDSRALLSMLPYMPPEGQNLAIRQYITSQLGHGQFTDVYVPMLEADQLPSADQKLAEQENNLMSLGFQQSIIGNDVLHAKVHAPDIFQLVQAVTNQQIDPGAFIAQFEIKMPHIQAHIQKFSGDPNQQPLYSALRQELEAATKIYNQIKQRYEQEMQKAMQEQQQAVPQSDPMQEIEVADRMSKIREREAKTQIAAAKLANDLENSSQKRAIADLETSETLR